MTHNFDPPPTVLPAFPPLRLTLALPQHRDAAAANATPPAITEGSTSPPPLMTTTPSIPVEVRWGVEPQFLAQLVQLHDCSFPIDYDAEYYRWLLGEVTPNSLVFVAYTTAEDYWRLQERHATRSTAAESLVATAAASAAASPRAEKGLREEGKRRSLTAELAAARASGEVPFHITSHHCTAKRDEVAALVAARCKASTVVPSSTVDEDDPAPSPFTVVIGFAAGMMGYAQHTDGQLLTNPTGYLGSLAVDPILRGCGLGDRLLGLFLQYITSRVPLRAADYLHYDAHSMYELVLAQDQKETQAVTTVGSGGVSAAEAAEDVSAVGTSHEAGLIHTLLALPRKTAAHLLHYVLADVFAWLERRKLRDTLTAQGLSDEAVQERLRQADLRALGVLESLTPDQFSRANPIMQIGVREVWLHCLKGDMALRSFYEKRGFCVMRALSGYFEIQDVKHDAVLLVYTPPPKSAGDSTELSRQPNLSAVVDTMLCKPQESACCSASVPAHPQSIKATSAISSSPTWLTRDVYTDVDISLQSVTRCRHAWRRHRDGQDAVLDDDKGDWLHLLQNILFTLNGLGVLAVLCYSVYTLGRQ